MKQPWPVTDKTKISKLASGNETAWFWFHDTYGQIIYRMLLGLGLHKADADDVAQTVFEKMMKANYKGSGRFRWFLLTTVRNAFIDHKRKTKREPVGTGDTAMLDFFELQPDSGPDDPFALEYEKQLLRTAESDVRAEFNSTYWEVFWRLQDGEDRKQIAASLNVSTGNTRVMQTRITRRIKQRVRELEADFESKVSQASQK